MERELPWTLAAGSTWNISGQTSGNQDHDDDIDNDDEDDDDNSEDGDKAKTIISNLLLLAF